MSDFRPYGALYEPFGHARRNDPIAVEAVNPIEDNAMSHDTGNAGRDGYTVLSRANRYDGRRPFINGVPQYEGPKLSED